MAEIGLTPVSRQRHGKRYWKRFSSFDFVSGMKDCVVVNAEILLAAATFPIAFSRCGQGFYPVAVLSMASDHPTPFVSTQGRWLAAYVPSELRCFPFRCELTNNQDAIKGPSFELLVDEKSGLVTTDPANEAFFDPVGELAPEVRKVEFFFQTLSRSMQDTFTLCRVFEEMGLFSPLKAPQGTPTPDGYYGIDTGALRKTQTAKISLLAQNDGLRLIHAHQVSLSHFNWLSKAQADADRLNTQKHDNAASNLPSFLDALAAAQESESALGHHSHEGRYAVL